MGTRHGHRSSERAGSRDVYNALSWSRLLVQVQSWILFYSISISNTVNAVRSITIQHEVRHSRDRPGICLQCFGSDHMDAAKGRKPHSRPIWCICQNRSCHEAGRSAPLPSGLRYQKHQSLLFSRRTNSWGKLQRRPTIRLKSIMYVNPGFKFCVCGLVVRAKCVKCSDEVYITWPFISSKFFKILY